MDENKMISDDIQNDVVECADETSPVDKEKNTISADLIRGHINTIILRTLYERDKYGYEIIDEIEVKSHGQYTLKQPTLYSALKRLESQGYIRAYWKSDEVSAGGRRKYFTLTDSGKEITEKNLAEWEYSRTVIDNLISDKSFDFSQPAPTAVDFNILKKSTSRVPRVKLEEVDGKDETANEDFLAEQRELLEKNEATLKEIEEKSNTNEELLAEQRELLEKNETTLKEIEQKSNANEELLAEQREILEKNETTLKEIEQKSNANEELLAEQREILEKNETTLKEIEQKNREYNEQNDAALKIIEEKRIELERQKAVNDERAASLNEFEENLNSQKIELDAKQRIYEDELLKQREDIERQRLEFESKQSINNEKLSSLNEYEAQLNAQKAAFEQQQQSYEAMLAAQRQAINEQQQALEIQRQTVAKQQYENERIAIENEKQLQARIEEEQRKLAHSNFIKLINGQPQATESTTPHSDNVSTESLVYNLKPEAERDYRNIVNKLFANTVKTVVQPATAIQQESSYSSSTEQYQPVKGDDAAEKAAVDGIKISASNSSVKTRASKPPYDMGFTLLKSSLIVSVIMLVEFVLTLLFRDTLGVGIAYPIVILAITLIQVLMSAAICFSGTLKSYKRPTSSNYISTSIIITIVLILIICLIALLLNVNFSSIGDICAKMLIPCAVSLNVPIYSIAFYLFSK